MKIRGFAGQSGGNSSNWIPPEPPQPTKIYIFNGADKSNVVIAGQARYASITAIDEGYLYVPNNNTSFFLVSIIGQIPDLVGNYYARMLTDFASAYNLLGASSDLKNATTIAENGFTPNTQASRAYVGDEAKYNIVWDTPIAIQENQYINLVVGRSGVAGQQLHIYSLELSEEPFE